MVVNQLIQDYRNRKRDEALNQYWYYEWEDIFNLGQFSDFQRICGFQMKFYCFKVYWILFFFIVNELLDIIF